MKIDFKEEPIPRASRTHWKLFLASFLALYFELLVIRYVSTELVVFGTLKNLPLIASFFGLGVGFLGTQKTQVRTKILAFSALALFLLARFGSKLPLPSLGWEYGLLSGDHARVLSVLTFLVFVTATLWLIVGLFVVLGSLVSEQLDPSFPLASYGVNLAGSLAGVLVFTFLSFLRTSPVVWLAIGFTFLLPWIWRQWAVVATLAALLAITAIPQPNAFWSPYHRIDIEPIRAGGSSMPSAFRLSYNHVSYQTMVNLSQEFLQQNAQAEPNRSVRDYYELPYRIVSKPEDVLVVGAGTGNDVAAALRHGAQHVDAVEIDPVILDMGRRYHPEHPYADPRVSTYVDDARSFFGKTTHRYDTIVFGFLDSSTLLTSFSSLRLDNYVYTSESFVAARKLLKPGGALILAFAVTRGYVANRLFATLTAAFGAEPRAFVTRTNVWGMLYVEGMPEASELAGVHEATQELRESGRDVEVATDTWPFLYLNRKSIPLPILIVLLTFASTCWIWQRRKVNLALNSVETIEFFLLGAGFLLMETKAVTQLSLLYGSTWVVNAAVICAFLLMALAANTLAVKIRLKSNAIYAALLLMLALGSFVSYSSLSGATLVIKLVASGFWAALPVFLSGLIVSSKLKDTPSLPTALGANLLGALVGGMLENAVMLGGIVVTGWITFAIYAAALLCTCVGQLSIVQNKQLPGHELSLRHSDEIE